MTKKSRSNIEKKTIQRKDVSLKGITDREGKIMNSIANTSIILMSTMMGAFSEILVNTTGGLASGMAGAFGGKEVEEKVEEEFKQKLPEVDEKIKAMISDIRKDIYLQLGQKRREIEPFLSDPVYDIGPKTIEKYDFKLPKLTQELNDSDLAKYTQLLIKEDSSFGEMFKELANWINTLPKFPDNVDKEQSS
jgi:hypothetical protein